MFVHEAKMVLPVVDAAIVVVDGVAGVEVVTQRVWNYCEEYKTPPIRTQDLIVQFRSAQILPDGKHDRAFIVPRHEAGKHPVVSADGSQRI